MTIWAENEVRNLPASDFRQLTETDPDSWHAFTLRIGTRHLIVYNSSQSDPRINSVLMHELAHIILGHDLHEVAISEDGHLAPTNYSQEQEDEANWFGGTLLLPRPALLRIRREGMSDQEAMNLFRVSSQMLTWRFRMTGVDYQLANRRRARAS